MIIGIGNDLIDIRRVAEVLERHDERFIKRCFTDTEIAKAESRREAGTHIDTYAKRFAAKEAGAKALGTGIRNGIYLRDIGVINDENGKPTLALTGGALAQLNKMVPAGKKPLIHLTLTDEPPMAQAFVVIEVI